MLNPDRKEAILFAPNVVKPQQIKAYEKVGVKVINSVENCSSRVPKKEGCNRERLSFNYIGCGH